MVVLLHHGNYLHTPFWNYRKPRRVPLYTTMTQVLTAGDVAEKSAAEIGDVIRQAMDYDEYRWQREKGIRITEPFRAEGLHKVLYQCPRCLAESKMESHGAVLRCAACGKEWELDELGVLHAREGRRSSPIPRTGSSGSGVRSGPAGGGDLPLRGRGGGLLPAQRLAVPEAGDSPAHPRHGAGLRGGGEHNGQPYRIHQPPLGMYGLHVEYDYCYVRPEDCVDISTDNDSLYCYPKSRTW